MADKTGNIKNIYAITNSENNRLLNIIPKEDPEKLK